MRRRGGRTGTRDRGHRKGSDGLHRRRRLARRYLNSTRYTLEVDYREHARQLRGDMKRGVAG